MTSFRVLFLLVSLPSCHLLAGDSVGLVPALGLRWQSLSKVEVAAGPGYVGEHFSVCPQVTISKYHTGFDLYLGMSPTRNTSTSIFELFLRPRIQNFNVNTGLSPIESWHGRSLGIEAGALFAADGLPLQVFIGYAKSSSNNEHKSYAGIAVGW